jgi:hypothetical protein
MYINQWVDVGGIPYPEYRYDDEFVEENEPEKENKELTIGDYLEDIEWDIWLTLPNELRPLKYQDISYRGWIEEFDGPF